MRELAKIEPCHKCGKKPKRIRIMCECGVFIEHHAGNIYHTVEAWNRHMEKKVAENEQCKTFTIGEDVLLRPYSDLKAIVRGVYIGENDLKYECAWFRNDGSRCIEFFFPGELETVK